MRLNVSLSYDACSATGEEDDLDYAEGNRNLAEYNLDVNNGYCLDYNMS